MTDVKAERIEWVRDLFLGFYCGADHFNALLIKLIHKADPSNRERLAQAFPVAVSVKDEWSAAPSGTEFFQRYPEVTETIRGERERALYARQWQTPESPSEPFVRKTRALQNSQA